jgi:hypothetical protein
MARTRSSVTLATLPWLIVLPIALAITTSHHVITYNGFPQASLTGSARVASDSYSTMQSMVLVGFGVAFFGWIALTGGIRESHGMRRGHVVALSYVPVLSFAAVLGLFLARMTQISNGGHSHGATFVATGGNPAAAHALLIALWSVFVVGMLASVASVIVVTRRAQLPILTLRSGMWVAIVMAIVLTVMAASAIAWGIALGGQPNAPIYTSAGLVRFVGASWWLTAAVPLTFAAFLSAAGAFEARRAWRVTAWLVDPSEATFEQSRTVVRDKWVPVLVLLGGFLVLVGWFVGIALLWSSQTWRLRDKLLGTLLWPGGLVGVSLMGLAGSRVCGTSGGPGQPTIEHCTTSGFVPPIAVGITILAAMVAVPIIVAVHLERVRRASQQSAVMERRNVSGSHGLELTSSDGRGAP